MKKILYIITKSNWGGAQRYVFDLATDLPPDDFEVTVALGGEGLLKERLEKERVKIVAIPHLDRDVRMSNDLRVFFDLIKIFRKVQPDIIHLNSSKIGGLGALAGRVARVPKIVFTAHGWAFNEQRSFISKLIIKILSWVTIILSHETIAVSKSVKKQVFNWPFISGKTTVVHNAIAAATLKSRDEAREILLSGYSHTSHEVWLGTIAELHKNKGLEYAIEAVAILIRNRPSINLRYIIIGEGEERNKLQKLIEKYGISHQVSLVGYYLEAASLLKAFDIYILPSITEAFSYTLLETGNVALPVITSNVGGTPEIVEDKVTGLLVRPRNVSDIVNSLESILDNPEMAQRLARKLQDKVTQQFNLPRMIEETIAIYTR